MNIVILLSAGRHPRSGAPRPVPVELQAVALACALPDATISGLHAGTADDAVRDALAHGLSRVTILRIDPLIDPLPALVAALTTTPPDLILAGRRGLGGTDSGVLPYRLAHALSWPIVADAIAIAPALAPVNQPATLAITQALPRGARRRILVARPAIVTIHEAAPPARPFTHRARRTGIVTTQPGTTGPNTASPATAIPAETRLYRARPRLIAPATASTGGRLMLDPTPDAAAAAILAYLARALPNP